MKVPRISCMDVFITCRKCGKLVHQSMFPVEDYQHCELNHVFCCECVEKEKIEKCPVCEEPLEYKRDKTYFCV